MGRTTELLLIGHLNHEQQIASWGDTSELPVLVFVETLEDATQLIETDPGSIRLVLVDLRALGRSQTA